MENYSQNYYENIKKALEKIGYKVEEIAKQGKKTIITVFTVREEKMLKRIQEKRRK